MPLDQNLLKNCIYQAPNVDTVVTWRYVRIRLFNSVSSCLALVLARPSNFLFLGSPAAPPRKALPAFAAVCLARTVPVPRAKPFWHSQQFAHSRQLVRFHLNSRAKPFQHPWQFSTISIFLFLNFLISWKSSFRRFCQ